MPQYVTYVLTQPGQNQGDVSAAVMMLKTLWETRPVAELRKGATSNDLKIQRKIQGNSMETQWFSRKKHLYPYAPCMAYLPTFASTLIYKYIGI